MYILKWRALKNWQLLLNNLVSHWYFYKVQPIQDIKINDLVWENWLKNISQRHDFYYINPKIIHVLKLIITYVLLKANLPLPINIP